MPEWPPHEPDEETEEAYDLDDPKHPTFADRWFEESDRRRKEARENLLFPTPEEIAKRQAELDKRHASRRAGKGKR